MRMHIGFFVTKEHRSKVADFTQWNDVLKVVFTDLALKLVV